MNWTALVVVTGLTTLYFIIQYADYVAHHRQYDRRDVEPPPVVHPVNEPTSSAAVGASSSASNDAILSSPPCGHHRGLGFSVDARSDDDDCSASYLPNSPGQSETTRADDSRNLNNACSSAQWPDASSDSTDGWQLSAVNYGNMDYARDQNNFNGRIQQMAHCQRNFEEPKASSQSFDLYEDTRQSHAARMTPPSSAVRRISVVIEIGGTPCNVISDHTPEAVAAADDADSELSAGQSSGQERPPGEPSWQRVLRWLERFIEFMLCVNFLVALVRWTTGDSAAPGLNVSKPPSGKFW